MARIRTIKPSFWKHEELSELPAETHMLAAALLNYADDHGYFNANDKLIRAECCPLRELLVSVPESIQSLQTINYIRLGTTPDGKRYGQVVKFEEHQKVSHPTDSKIATLSIAWDEFWKPQENFANPPEPLRPEKEEEGNKEEEKDSVAQPSAAPQIDLTPEPEDDPLDLPEFLDKRPNAKGTRLADDWKPSEADREFARSIGFDEPRIDATADRFRDYWIGCPGQKGVKRNWPATWRNWCRNDAERNPPAGKSFNGGSRSVTGGVVAALGRVQSARARAQQHNG